MRGKEREDLDSKIKNTPATLETKIKFKSLAQTLSGQFKGLATNYKYQILLIVSPLIIATINHKWLFDKADIDVWFYDGYYRVFEKYWNTFAPNVASTYYGTRIPTILPGYLSHYIFGESFGKIVFNLILVSSTISISLFSIFRNFVSDKLSFIAAMSIFADPYLIKVLGSDYISSPSAAFALISIALLLTTFRTQKIRYAFLSGAFIEMSITTHMMACIYISVLVAILMLNKKTEFLKRHIFKIIRWFTYGGLIAVLFWGSIFSLAVHHFNLLYFTPEFRIALNQGDLNPFAYSLKQLTTIAYWDLLPFVGLLVTVLIWLSKSRKKSDGLRLVTKFLVLPPTLFLVIGYVANSSMSKMYLSRDGLYTPFLNILLVPLIFIFLFEKIKISVYWIYVGILMTATKQI